jgi:hypothetical protein
MARIKIKRPVFIETEAIIDSIPVTFPQKLNWRIAYPMLNK